jgi:hypothetical protein
VSAQSRTASRLDSNKPRLVSITREASTSGARTPTSSPSRTSTLTALDSTTEEDRRRADFAADTCKLLIALNASWSGADQPFVRHFFEKHLQGRPKLLSSGTLSGRVLDEVAQGIIERWRLETEGQYGSSQSDGWKNISRHQILGNLIVVNGKVCRLVHLIVCSER